MALVDLTHDDNFDVGLTQEESDEAMARRLEREEYLNAQYLQREQANTGHDLDFLPEPTYEQLLPGTGAQYQGPPPPPPGLSEDARLAWYLQHEQGAVPAEAFGSSEIEDDDAALARRLQLEEQGSISDAELAQQMQEEENRREGVNRAQQGHYDPQIPFGLRRLMHNMRGLPFEEPAPPVFNAGDPNALMMHMLQGSGMRHDEMAQIMALLEGRQAMSRDIDGATYEDLLRLQEQLGVVSRGATSEQIDELPTSTAPAADTNNEHTSCAVCLEDYVEGESLRTLPCLHQFHTKCVDTWLKQNRACPICKIDVCTRDGP